ncbi:MULTISPECIES: hypothetical protein [Saccharothrix]|uniref:hypothetical protein n=1 Tax=Saccharothrix TaxID=2071 RepID=UPI00093B65B2|nr:hypothetical protein [Saccharothrix sp. CB00851]OKI38691.1 hypothetical protein A6A25_00230 [Saccharothrix sp. CB00851]
MTQDTKRGVEVVELSEVEAAAMFDRVTRRHMGISAEEFLARWDAGEWTDADLDDVDGLVEVWAYLPAVR